MLVTNLRDEAAVSWSARLDESAPGGGGSVDGGADSGADGDGGAGAGADADDGANSGADGDGGAGDDGGADAGGGDDADAGGEGSGAPGWQCIVFPGVEVPIRCDCVLIALFSFCDRCCWQCWCCLEWCPALLLLPHCVIGVVVVSLPKLLLPWPDARTALLTTFASRFAAALSAASPARTQLHTLTDPASDPHAVQ
jgi:hypothetical protein